MRCARDRNDLLSLGRSGKASQRKGLGLEARVLDGQRKGEEAFPDGNRVYSDENVRGQHSRAMVNSKNEITNCGSHLWAERRHILICVEKNSGSPRRMDRVGGSWR